MLQFVDTKGNSIKHLNYYYKDLPTDNPRNKK